MQPIRQKRPKPYSGGFEFTINSHRHAANRCWISVVRPELSRRSSFVSPRNYILSGSHGKLMQYPRDKADPLLERELRYCMFKIANCHVASE